MTEHTVPRHILPVIVLAQLLGTSLWFAVNAVMPDLQRELGWPTSTVGTLTSALQFGFILGTLVFALLALADRFAPRQVFLVCALAGAGCTVGAWAMVRDQDALMLWRFATGFFLAGIYPVGMKIAAQWYSKGLGGALGFLIGALVLGSASPHALRALGDALPWPTLMLGVAALAALGGVLLYLCTGDPPGAVARIAWPITVRMLSAITMSQGPLRASCFSSFRTSGPLRPGMLMSITTRSKVCSRTWSNISWALPHSAMLAPSNPSSRISFTPRRKEG